MWECRGGVGAEEGAHQGRAVGHGYIGHILAVRPQPLRLCAVLAREADGVLCAHTQSFGNRNAAGWIEHWFTAVCVHGRP